MDQLNEKTGTWRSSRSNYGRLINYDHFRPRVFHINNLKNNDIDHLYGLSVFMELVFYFWPGFFNHMDNWSGTTPSLVDNVVHLGRKGKEHEIVLF